MYCITCGKLIPDSAQYCPFCGQACPAADTPAEDNAPRLPSDMPVTAEDIPSEPADSAASSADPAAPDCGTPTTEPVTSPANPDDHSRPLLKWIYIGLGSVACIALVLVIWGIVSRANAPSPAIKTVLPQSSTAGNSTLPQQTPSVTPKVTVPNTTPKVTAPGTTSNTTEDAVPKEGETLYEGHSSYDDISDVKLRFILSADHTQIHDISIACEGLSGKIQSNVSNTSVSISKVTQMFQGQFPVDYSGTTTEIKLGSSAITSLTFSGETARAELDYTYHMTGTGTNVQDIDIPFGTTWFDLTAER